MVKRAKWEREGEREERGLDINRDGTIAIRKRENRQLRRREEWRAPYFISNEIKLDGWDEERRGREPAREELKKLVKNKDLICMFWVEKK